MSARTFIITGLPPEVDAQDVESAMVHHLDLFHPEVRATEVRATEVLEEDKVPALEPLDYRLPPCVGRLVESYKAARAAGEVAEKARTAPGSGPMQEARYHLAIRNDDEARHRFHQLRKHLATDLLRELGEK